MLCESCALLPNSPICVNTNSRPAISAAFMNALCQVGGLFSRASRALWRCSFFCSSAVRRRPVRPRDSTTPAALPRCLVRRLRLVCAMGWVEGRRKSGQQGRSGQRYFGREGFERAARGGCDELRLRDLGVLLHLPDDVTRRRPREVL